jgi:hypothetical protein
MWHTWSSRLKKPGSATVHESESQITSGGAGITRIPAAVDGLAISLGMRGHVHTCLGAVKELQADSSVVSNFAVHGIAGPTVASYSGFLAKVKASLRSESGVCSVVNHCHECQ